MANTTDHDKSMDLLIPQPKNTQLSTMFAPPFFIYSTVFKQSALLHIIPKKLPSGSSENMLSPESGGRNRFNLRYRRRRASTWRIPCSRFAHRVQSLGQTSSI